MQGVCALLTVNYENFLSQFSSVLTIAQESSQTTQQTQIKLDRQQTEKGLRDETLILTDFVSTTNKRLHDIWSTFGVICYEEDESKVLKD